MTIKNLFSAKNRSQAGLFIFTLFLAGLLGSCNGRTEVAYDITSESLMQHVEVLSSDEFMGRSPGTEGEQKTADYIVSRFEEYGLRPGAPDGSFIQPVPLLGQSTDRGSARLTFTKNGQTVLEPDYYTEFMAWPAQDQEMIHINDAELVYVGYGIQAPEENWDDFKDADVEGKVLIVKNFNPVTHPDLFEGGIRLYYGRWSYKFEKAAEMGALGALIIHTDETAGYGWDVVANSWSLERFTLQTGLEHDTDFEGWLNHQISEELFSQAGLDLGEMLEAAENPDFRPIELGDVRLGLHLEADYQMLEGQNVIGKIRGSDRRLRDEAVVFSAHHDHLGVGEPVDGDSIFNGAWDNASGTSAVLELARILNQNRRHIHRSMYFAAVTAEEAGLLGSQYFAENPPVPPGQMAANINLDAINIFGRTRDIVAIGYGRSDIDGILEAEAAALDRIVLPDQAPEQGFFYRSDHFSFARAGVPALYIGRGSDFLDYPDDYEEQVREYTRHIYHTVHDRVHDWWDLRGAVEDLELVYRVARRIANEDDIRHWVPGDEFEAARQASLEALNGR